MLILCSGPDTLRAQQYAKKLEHAFCEKYHTEQSGIEHIPYGKAGLKVLEEKAQTMSLFASKRFFRTRNLLKELSKKELPSLVRALSKSAEDIVVVSVEDDAPKKEYLTVLEKEMKIINYSHPIMRGRAFSAWLTDEAKHLGVKNLSAVKAIAEVHDSDTWRAWNELMKFAAGGEASQSYEKTETVFTYLDRILFAQKNRYAFLGETDICKEVSALLLSQMKTAVRIRDGYADGVHPYVRKKLSRANLSHAGAAFFQAELMHLLARKGYAKEGEISLLIK